MTAQQKLLIVDDSDAEREIMALTLNAAFPDADVRVAASPSTVGALCDETSFDCVLLDYNMPEMDGLELGQQLRASNAYLPIVLVTGMGDEMLAAEALRSGISDYIPKSRITAEAIQRTIARSIHVSAQARLIDEQKAELENFAYALAHDFKQPIRQIMTFAQLISEGLRTGETKGLEQALTFLGDAAGRLGRLVDVMSQYTLLNEPPALTEVSLERVIAAVRTSLSPYLIERDAEFASPAAPPTVRGNETLMTQVLQNLVVNALQYNQSPTPRVELTVRREGNDWILSLADNGIGIEAEYLAEIFRPLVRLHNASEYQGSGLGLTLARKAVLAQQGLIWCESTPGEGSTFHIRLPAAGAL